MLPTKKYSRNFGRIYLIGCFQVQIIRLHSYLPLISDSGSALAQSKVGRQQDPLLHERQDKNVSIATSNDPLKRQ
ncbi:hypothetical protein PROFUN_14607 [Planoprotostelium fungivorum]|uniref:Uncharacterized protein n=1 Tax=Planoprotostelium fungivorum TaxID=1890364 RepID=A0A2P6MZC7_9EUKA|nr:hypothetical protein PROFUN_14607 [Planoprotostelium fungivorum]